MLKFALKVTRMQINTTFDVVNRLNGLSLQKTNINLTKPFIMKTFFYPSNENQRQNRNAVIFWAVITMAVILVCIYSPNVF